MTIGTLLRSRRVFAGGVLLLATILLASCGGGAGRTGLAGSVPSDARATVPVFFTIRVPSKQSASFSRDTKYISPSTQSALLYEGAPGASSINSAGVASCAAGTCSGSVDAPVGTDVFAVVLFDKPGGSGNALAKGVVTATISQGVANVVHVVFNGLPAAVQISAPQSAFTSGVASSIPLTISLLDADGNIITGPGAFNITLTDSDTSGATTLSASAITYSNNGATDRESLIYNGNPVSSPITIGANFEGAAIGGAKSFTIGGSAPPFASGTPSAVASMQQNGGVLEAFVYPASTAAFLSVQSRTITSRGQPIAQGAFTVSVNSGLTPFGITRGVDLNALRAMRPRVSAAGFPDGPLRAIDSSNLLKVRPDTHTRSATAFATMPLLGSSRVFNVEKFAITAPAGSPSTNIPVPFTLKAISNHGFIWVDNSLLSQAHEDPSMIGNQFDASYASDIAHFGGIDYNDSAVGATTYATCDSKGNLDGGSARYPVADLLAGFVHVLIVNPTNLGAGVGGYFDGTNFYPQGEANCFKANGPVPSNEAPMIVVGDFNDTAFMRAGTAHELQHLINDVHHSILNGVPDDPAWLNEGLSKLSEDLVNNAPDLHGTVPDAAVFLASPQDYSLTAFSGYENGAFISGCHGCYGNSYLFMRYLYDRFGPAIATNLEDNNGSAIEAVLLSTGAADWPTLFNDYGTMLGVSGTGITVDPRWQLSSLNLRGQNTNSSGSVTLNGPGAIGTLAPGQVLTVSGQYQGAPAYVNIGTGAGGRTVKVVDNSGGALSLFGSIGQR